MKCFWFNWFWVSLDRAYTDETEGCYVCVCLFLLTWWKDNNSKEGTSILCGFRSCVRTQHCTFCLHSLFISREVFFGHSLLLILILGCFLIWWFSLLWCFCPTIWWKHPHTECLHDLTGIAFHLIGCFAYHHIQKICRLIADKDITTYLIITCLRRHMTTEQHPSDVVNTDKD